MKSLGSALLSGPGVGGPLVDIPKPPAISYTPEEAAAVVARSRTRIFKAIRDKEITARKDGRATLIERTELMRWLGTLPTIGRKPK